MPRYHVALLLMACSILFGCVRVTSGYGIGSEDNGKTKEVKVGSDLRLVLRGDFDWQLESTNMSALALTGSQVGTVGGSPVRIWEFDVKSAGTFVLRASGDATCRKAVPPCAVPSEKYEFTIVAK